ncbi:hypothetical protein FE392_14480 [Xenorhabdus sp. 12]|uniref:Invasin n=1 Tax=Xenorhabdus santafensis TaxID=2582833 RepID=A0ABU4SCI7_9GAMM|nr:DUF823 domain-containing adhesin [Xenorhabdus sp. 12]MDX7988523.1 hypothetical protein [Xenorhabdus sp. 12]
MTTTVDGKKNPQPLELEFDVNKAPSVKIDHLEGELTIGKTLTASYKFSSNDSNANDRSFYVWGEKGTTADRVMKLAEAAGVKEPIELEQKNGEGRVIDGKPITYIIQESDKKKKLEVSILAANDANLRAKGPETMVVDDQKNANTITGGNGKGGVADPNALPEVDELDLTGKLELSSTLTVSYKFMPNGGDARDKSRFAWKIQSKEGDAMNWQDVDQPAQGNNKGQAKLILEKELASEIPGNVIVMSILPANSIGKQNLDGIKKVTTVPGSPGNNTTGGNNGAIVDPDAKSIVKNLELHGKLQTGEKIRGKYHFDANKGDPVDHSVYTWYRVKSKPNEGPDKDKIPSVPDENAKKEVIHQDKVPNNGVVPEYTLEKSEFLHFIQLEVQGMFKGQPVEAPLVVTSNLVGEDKNGNKNLAGGGSGSGRVIDPTIGPDITKLTLVTENGTDGKTYLAATYHFEHNHGETSDVSHYKWGEYAPGEEFTTRTEVARDGTPVTPGQDISVQPHKVPRYHKPLEDLYGRVIALSVLAKSATKTGYIRDEDTKKSNTVVDANTDGTIKGKADDIDVKMNKTEAKARVNLLNKDQPLSDDESARLTIKTTKGGTKIGGVPVTIDMTFEVRTPDNLKRSDFPADEKPKLTAKLEVEDKKGVLYDDVKTQDRKVTYTGHTDENGDLIIKVTDPDGKGVRTIINVSTEGASKKEVDVKFTVITSPNVKNATYYGHMEDIVTTKDGLVFHRPTIQAEVGGYTNALKPIVNGEIWTYIRKEQIITYCSDSKRKTPNSSEYRNLILELNQKFNLNKDAIEKRYGWPTKWPYFASDKSSANGDHRIVDFSTGDIDPVIAGKSVSQSIACRNP